MTSVSQLEAVKGAKALMVGAGGIGCELLKTLALSGFEDIHIVWTILLLPYVETLSFGSWYSHTWTLGCFGPRRSIGQILQVWIRFSHFGGALDYGLLGFYYIRGLGLFWTLLDQHWVQFLIGLFQLHKIYLGKQNPAH